MSEVEVERLIKAVEASPCLWDCNDKDYSNRDVRDSAWELVCKEVSNDWEGFDASMFNNACEILKKKWTHIRDYYRRDLTRRKPKYKYAPMLVFLKPYYDNRSNGQRSENESDTEQQSVENQNEDSTNEVHEQEIEVSPSCNEDSDASLQSLSPKAPKKRTKRMGNGSGAVWTSNLRVVTPEHQQTSSYDDADDDEKFLLSFRSNMRCMNSSQKLDFKIGMLQLLKAIMSNEESS